MNGHLIAAAVTATALAGCSPARPNDLVERLTADLSRREGRPISIGAITRKRLDGQEVACGMFYAPGDQRDRLPAGTGYFAAIDGQLLAPDKDPRRVPGCEQAFPQLRPIYD